MTLIIRLRDNVSIRGEGTHCSLSSPEGTFASPDWPEEVSPQRLAAGVNFSTLKKHLCHTEPFQWLGICCLLANLCAFSEYQLIARGNIVARYFRKNMRSSSIIFCNRLTTVQYRASPYAFIRLMGENLLQIEMANVPALLCLYDPLAITTFLFFHRKVRIDDLDSDGILNGTDALEFIDLLIDSGALLEAVPGETDIQNRWEFHDALFHGRSRLGGHLGGYGGTWRFGVPNMETGASAHPPCEDAIDLPRDCPKRENSLESIVRRRRTIRNHGPSLISKEQIGEFLLRTAELTTVEVADKRTAVSGRFPSGGNLHELELFPVIGQCNGLRRGMYWYDRWNHQLLASDDSPEYVSSVLEFARRAMIQEDEPQVLIAICSRMDVVQTKYESMSYALTLKNVGVLLQTMYLIATDMGLAPCALGGGPGTLHFERGGQRRHRSWVSEFAVGASDVSVSRP